MHDYVHGIQLRGRIQKCCNLLGGVLIRLQLQLDTNWCFVHVTESVKERLDPICLLDLRLWRITVILHFWRVQYCYNGDVAILCFDRFNQGKVKNTTSRFDINFERKGSLVCLNKGTYKDPIP